MSRANTTHRQDAEFHETVVDRNVLETSCDWMDANLEPDQVFSDPKLQRWARRQSVEDVTTPEALDAWADENGYVKEG